MEIVVADDDPACSARPLIEAFAKSSPVAVRYVESAARNISACRNACLHAAQADWIAFIDDDQVVEPTWLREMIITAQACQADVIKCYVRGIYPPQTPHWIKAGGPYTYDYGPTGTEIPFAHTCGVLFRRDFPGGRDLFFDTAPATWAAKIRNFSCGTKRSAARSCHAVAPSPMNSYRSSESAPRICSANTDVRGISKVAIRNCFRRKGYT